MLKKILFVCCVALLITVPGCAKTPEQKPDGGSVKVGSVTINRHPATLNGKTVVLRWNSKFNGDKFLDRLAVLLSEKMPGVKVVKMYIVDPSTAEIAKSVDESRRTADKIAAMKPDLVIAAQAD